MKLNKKILYVFWLLFIFVSVAYASLWKAWWWVKWISENSNDQAINRFTNYTWDSLDWVWYYLDTYTWLKWASVGSTYAINWVDSCSTSSSSNNYCVKYPEPEWNWTNYIYTLPPYWYQNENFFEAHKYCDNLWNWNWWRLPTKNEFISIMTDDFIWTSWYTALPSIAWRNGYWSSSVSLNAWNWENFAWYADFTSGRVRNTYKYELKYAICVHD